MYITYHFKIPMHPHHPEPATLCCIIDVTAALDTATSNCNARLAAGPYELANYAKNVLG
jgi:hypothetical protein